MSQFVFVFTLSLTTDLTRSSKTGWSDLISFETLLIRSGQLLKPAGLGRQID